MSQPTLRRAPVVALLALAAVGALVAGVLRAEPADAGVRVTPGAFTGLAFDACQAPSQEAMDVWLERSPYWAVGVYIAGDNRYCHDQVHLDADWVAEQSRKGWRLLPLVVGRQAACTSVKRWAKISANPDGGYATARRQGRVEAREGAAAARDLGIARGSTLWLDMEAFDVGNDRCRRSTLAFVSGWTRRLREDGFRSGFYSSASSGIAMLDRARAADPGRDDLPHQLWVADWNGRADTRSTAIGGERWARQRVHQYTGGHRETWGGVSIEIDANAVDVGGGTRAPKPPPHCGVNLDFGRYRTLARGDRDPQVAALQCLLRRQRFGSLEVTGRFTAPTVKAVRAFQDRRGLRVTGSVGRRDWMVLHAAGSTPFLKQGAGADAVRRLQRTLNAAAAEGLGVTGVFDAGTAAAVRRYQRALGRPGSGVVTGDLWVLLQRGRR